MSPIFPRPLWFSCLSLPSQWPMGTRKNPTSPHLTWNPNTRLLMFPRRNITKLHHTTHLRRTTSHLTPPRHTAHLNHRTTWKLRHTTLNHLTWRKDTANPNLTALIQHPIKEYHPTDGRIKPSSITPLRIFSDQMKFLYVLRWITFKWCTNMKCKHLFWVF